MAHLEADLVFLARYPARPQTSPPSSSTYTWRGNDSRSLDDEERRASICFCLLLLCFDDNPRRSRNDITQYHHHHHSRARSS